MKKRLSQVICLMLLVWAFYPWITQLISGHCFPQLIIIILILFGFLIEEKIKKFKYLIFLFPIFYVIFSFSRLQPIFKLNELDIYGLNQRRQYYPTSVARAFENKIGRYFYYYENSFFQATDFNYYFFNNHPRERAGIKETEKIIFIFFPVFILGLYVSLINKRYFWLLYYIFTLILISFFNPVDPLTFLFLPFFAVNINLGYKFIFKKITFY